MAICTHVLNSTQVVVGCDGHLTCPPLPVVFAPHVVVWTLGFTEDCSLPLYASASKATRGGNSNQSCGPRPVRCDGGFALARGHDAGRWVAHIWPNALLPLVLLSASNISEFGSSLVKVPDSGAKGDLAIALLYVVNPQLSCWDFPFPPNLTTVALAFPGTVYAGFSVTDIFYGFGMALLDGAIDYAIGILGETVGKVLEKGLKDALKTILSKGLKGFVGDLVSEALKPTRELSKTVADFAAPLLKGQGTAKALASLVAAPVFFGAGIVFGANAPATAKDGKPAPASSTGTFRSYTDVASSIPVIGPTLGKLVGLVD